MFEAGSSRFVYATTGENEVGLSAIRLVWKDGVVIGIVDDWLNGAASPGEPGTGLGEIERQKWEPARKLPLALVSLKVEL